MYDSTDFDEVFRGVTVYGFDTVVVSHDYGITVSAFLSTEHYAACFEWKDSCAWFGCEIDASVMLALTVKWVAPYSEF